MGQHQSHWPSSSAPAAFASCTFSAADDIPFNEDSIHSLVVLSFCKSMSKEWNDEAESSHFEVGGVLPVSILAAGTPL